jgi:hypothetical protein
MHYRGLLRTARREGGVRLYAARDTHPPAADPQAAYDALVTWCWPSTRRCPN